MSTISSTSTASVSHTRPTRAPSWLDRAARRTLFAALARLRIGHLIIRDGNDATSFGSSTHHPFAEIRVLDPRFYRACLTRGTLGAAEAFLDHWWTCDQLTDLVRLLVLNREAMRSIDSGWSKATLPLRRAAEALRKNTHVGSRRNIAAHYDLSNDLFALMLDPSMMYSCALFERPSMTLEEAQHAKLNRLCKRLDLSSTDHLLEIGTGWGACAMHAAEHFGCRVTTTTISKAQASLARERIAARGLSNRINVIEVDYRDLTGSFDKIISIEMIEAVGHNFLDAYFASCNRLLKPDGLFALQAITIQDRDSEHALSQVDFIQKHIFPGSFIPSLGALQSSIARSSALRVIEIEDIGPHYVPTLQAWRANFLSRLDDVRRLGFDERFIRLWTFYLCYCEGAFAERHIGDAHILLAGPHYRGRNPLPTT